MRPRRSRVIKRITDDEFTRTTKAVVETPGTRHQANGSKNRVERRRRATMDSLDPTPLQLHLEESRATGI